MVGMKSKQRPIKKKDSTLFKLIFGSDEMKAAAYKKRTPHYLRPMLLDG